MPDRFVLSFIMNFLTDRNLVETLKGPSLGYCNLKYYLYCAPRPTRTGSSRCFIPGMFSLRSECSIQKVLSQPSVSAS
jgi:hypothetical protein